MASSSNHRPSSDSSPAACLCSSSAPSSNPACLHEPQNQRSPGPQQLLTDVDDFVKAWMSQPPYDTSHDYTHIQRVIALSSHIANSYEEEHPGQNLDRPLMYLVAMLHDVADHKYTPRSRGGDSTHEPTALSDSRHLTNGAERVSSVHSRPEHAPSPSPVANAPSPSPIANTTSPSPVTNTTSPSPITNAANATTPETVLLNLNAPSAVARTVHDLASAVSTSRELAQPGCMDALVAAYPELGIVQDADKLDAMGAIGVGRAFTFGGAKGRTLGQSIDHWERLLVRESLMKTAEGSRLAAKRAEKLRAFREWWDEDVSVGTGGAVDWWTEGGIGLWWKEGR